MDSMAESEVVYYYIMISIGFLDIIVSTDESVDTMDLTLLRRCRRRRSM